MKKLSTLLICMFLVVLAMAKPVSIEKARQAADNYFTQFSGKKSLSILNSFSKEYNGITTYHVFNYVGGGFVVVSADDIATPILAQSNEGYIEMIFSNPNTEYWFDLYNKEIAHLVATKADNSQSASEWNQVLNGEMDASILDVGPLLTTIWDQGQWYNYYCPTAAGGPGGKCWAGCVATTMGQIMKYYNFPAKGYLSHSYTHPTYGTQTANFGATTYNFASMGNSANSSSYQQIATLLYQAGVSVNMNYAPDGSGAFSEDVPYSMSTYFNYDPSTIGIAYKSDFSASGWKDFLKSELDANRPLYYSGSGTAGGHAWVCDGYRSSDSKFHMNWGWSGNSNGYYAMGALNTGNGSYNSTNAVVHHIIPGNPNLVVRFTNLNQANTVAFGAELNIDCSVLEGTPTNVNLYIDNEVVFSTTQTTFTYPWNTAYAALGTHDLKVEAIDATDTVFHKVTVSVSEWISQASGFTTASRGITYISAVDSLIAWAAAYDGSPDPVTKKTDYITEVTKTINGGDLWIPTSPIIANSILYGIGNICALNANIAFAAVYKDSDYPQDNICGIYKTINGGSTWTHLPSVLQGATSFANNVWFWNENEGMCHGDVRDNYFEIYTTTNGGASWTRVPKANIGGGVNALSGEGGWTSVIEAVGESTIMFGTNKGNLYISHDKGKNWVISATGISPLSDGVQNICFKDENNGIVVQVKNNVVIKETHDGGATWQLINPIGSFLTSDITYVPNTDNTFVSTGASSGAIGASYSFDGGYSWNIFPGTETSQFLAVDFVNNHCGWAGHFNESATSLGIHKFVGLLVPTTVLSPVTDLVAQPLDNSVHLTWTEPITPPLSYNIYRDDVLLSNTPSLQYHDYPVANGMHTYCVTAVYDGGESARTCVNTWITTGLEPTTEASYRVYPNPATEVINLISPVVFKEVRLINDLGKVVYSNSYNGVNLKILTAGLRSGLYIMQIVTDNEIVSKKVTIK